MNRHVCRVCAMKILFSLDLNSSYNELEDLSRKIEFVMDPDYNSELTDSETEAFILENNPFVQELVLGVKHNLKRIDEVIVNCLKNYTIERLSYVDRAIIRLAVYELLETNTPASIIIDEAIEITKEYSNLEDEAQSKFTNRLLDDIKGLLGKCE
ncbi:MAG: transcription antitermination factor NusB [Bacilli bacterium]|nr:transcription antitermination factor NusB [Bacilli bacterium]